ncbi:MAG: MBL fold metallo-hydrolase [Flavobacteriaceae bacterium]|nr:MBL fold metallo-hydrolase [Flavobacteriaceae bacterium]
MASTLLYSQFAFFQTDYLTNNQILMKQGFYKFKLGEFECACLSDGGYSYKPESMFSNIPIDMVKEALLSAGLPTDHVWTPYTYVFVNNGEYNILIDMGAGQLADTTGKLINNMKSAKIEPESIDKILITHAHPDHIGGALDENGDPAFPNAEYYIWKDEWNFWFSDELLDLAPKVFFDIARKNLNPLKSRMHLIDKKTDLLTGIEIIPTPGHTPGHASFNISSNGDTLCYIGDVVLHPLHLEYPEWLPVYDIVPEKAALTKKRIFDMLSINDTWVVGQHFPPFPSYGHVKKQEKGWKWIPLS